MSFKRLLLVLRGYPVETPGGAIDTALDFAAALDARISALTCAVHPHVPKGPLSGIVGVVPALVTTEHNKVVASARQVVEAFSARATARGLLGEAIFKECFSSQVPGLLKGYARINDLTVLPMPAGSYLDRFNSHWFLETALFESGRPLLVLPYDYRSRPAGPLGTVVVAWDNSRCSARALADAMPALARAKTVRLLTVKGEKAIVREPSPQAVVAWLAAHGIAATHESVEAGGRGADVAIADFLREQKADLLVMGGYSHSRLRELVLGGVTRSMVTHPPLPVFLTH